MTASQWSSVTLAWAQMKPVADTGLRQVMNETSTHFYVPVPSDEREVCLGPDGSVAHVTRVIRMIHGCWKLPILFRLYADPSIRTLQLKRDLPGISQKMLTQHLRELADDGLVERIDFQRSR